MSRESAQINDLANRVAMLEDARRIERKVRQKLDRMLIENKRETFHELELLIG